MWARQEWARWEQEQDRALQAECGPDWRERHSIVWVPELAGYRCRLCPDKQLGDLWRVREHIRAKKHQNRSWQPAGDAGVGPPPLPPGPPPCGPCRVALEPPPPPPRPACGPCRIAPEPPPGPGPADRVQVAFELSEDIGMVVVEKDSSQKDSELVVKRVREGSQASRRGAQPGWSICSINKRPLSKARELAEEIVSLKRRGDGSALVSFSEGWESAWDVVDGLKSPEVLVSPADSPGVHGLFDFDHLEAEEAARQ